MQERPRVDKLAGDGELQASFAKSAAFENKGRNEASSISTPLRRRAKGTAQSAKSTLTTATIECLTLPLSSCRYVRHPSGDAR